jgi:uncharacterized protein (TIGR02453 family)
MGAFLQSVSSELTSDTWPLSGGPRTVLGQRRDTRFAPVPFHTTVRGLLSRHGGRLARDEGGVHVELAIDGGFVAAGLHRPPAAVLRPIRQAIIERPDEFEGIVDRLTARGYPLTDGAVATMPRRFERFSGEPYAGHLRRTTLTIVHRLDPADWTDGGAHTATVELCRAAMDLLAFVETAIRATSTGPLPVGRVGIERRPTGDE